MTLLLIKKIYLLILKNFKRKNDLDDDLTTKRTNPTTTIGSLKRIKYDNSLSNDVKEIF